MNVAIKQLKQKTRQDQDTEAHHSISGDLKQSKGAVREDIKAKTQEHHALSPSRVPEEKLVTVGV